MEQNFRNEVKLAGFISEMTISQTPESPEEYRDIYMNVAQYEYDRTGNLSPKLVKHHVFIREEAERCGELETVCQKTKEKDYIRKPEYIETSGSIMQDRWGIPCINAQEWTLLGQKQKQENSIIMSGTVIDTRSNSAYAGMVVETDMLDAGEKTGKIRLPLTARCDNPIYNAIEGGKYKEGDTVEISGSINSEKITDGQNVEFRCSICADEITLKKTKRQERQHGMRL